MSAAALREACMNILEEENAAFALADIVAASAAALRDASCKAVTWACRVFRYYVCSVESSSVVGEALALPPFSIAAASLSLSLSLSPSLSLEDCNSVILD